MATFEVRGLSPPAVPPEPTIETEPESSPPEASPTSEVETVDDSGASTPCASDDAAAEATEDDKEFESAVPPQTGPAADDASSVEPADEDPRQANPRPPIPPTANAARLAPEETDRNETASDDPRRAPPRPPRPSIASDDDLVAEPLAPAHPFGGGVEVPFDFPDQMQWLNTSEPVRLADLKGKFVLLDFWTYCCINCIHILPELKKLERAYPNDLVVIGVHSAKFETEKGTKNIEEAILRYEIEHPVVNDHEHRIWSMFGARSWPTVALIDPEGKFVGKINGEIQAEQFHEILQKAIPYYREQGLLDATPIKFDLLKDQQNPSPLKFPGKLLADEESDRLFIADSNNNRIVISSLEGELLDVIGTGAIGQTDGPYDAATFNKPQGMVLRGETLYVGRHRESPAPQDRPRREDGHDDRRHGRTRPQRLAGVSTSFIRLPNRRSASLPVNYGNSQLTARGRSTFTTTICSSPWRGRTRFGR